MRINSLKNSPASFNFLLTFLILTFSCKTANVFDQGNVIASTDYRGYTPLADASGNRAKERIIREMDKIASELNMALPECIVSREGQKVLLTLSSDNLFVSSKADLKYAGTLDVISPLILNYEYTDVTIAGHTDSMGAGTYNQKLSEERAISVLNYFIIKGIDDDRLEAKGYGEFAPVEKNLTAAGRAKNRRIEISLVPSKKMIKLAEKDKLDKYK